MCNYRAWCGIMPIRLISRSPNCWMTVSASCGWSVTCIRVSLHALTVIAPSADSSGSRATSLPAVAARVTATIRS